MQTATGQYLETTVLLPDTMLGLAGPTHLVWDSVTNSVYAAGGPGTVIIAIDALTGQKTAKIPLPGDPSSYVRTLCLDTDRRELYCFREDNVVSIIDCLRNIIVDSLRLPYSSYDDAAACYNPGTGKLYYAMGDDGIVVIDCARRRVVDTIPVRYAARVACSPRSNFVYCSTTMSPADSLFIINGAADTVDTVIPAASWIRLLYYGAGKDRIYCYGQASRSLSVFDCQTNRLLATVPLPGNSELYRACADTSGKRFVIVIGESLFVVDGESHHVRARIAPGILGWSICHNAAAGRFGICGGDWPGEAVFIDAVADTIVGRVQNGWQPNSIVSAGPLVYSGSASAVSMIDPATCSVLDTILTDARPRRVGWDANSDLLNCVSAGSLFPFTAMVDPARCEVQRWAWQLFAPEHLAVPGNGRLYGLVSGDMMMHLLSYDVLADSLLAMLRVGIAPAWFGAAGLSTNAAGTRAHCLGIDGIDGTYYLATADTERRQHLMQARLGVADTAYGPLWNPAADKVYLAGVVGSPQLLITDGTTGLPIHTLTLPAAGPLCCDPARNLVFCAGRTLSVVDGASDSVVTQWNLSDTAVASAACDPSLGRVYAVARNELFICASPTGQPLDTVALPTAGVAELVCDTIVGKVYCLDPSNRVVHVVDGREGRLLMSIPVGLDPMNMAWVPPHRRVFVLNRGNSRLSVIRDTTTGVEEVVGNRTLSRKPEPTLVRGVLWLGADEPGEVQASPRPQQCPWLATRSVLLDATGRKVMDLLPGPNDVGHLAPGVYHVRAGNTNEKKRLVILR